MQATLNYLNHLITIDLPNPEENNTCFVLIERQGAYLDDFQFSGESEDPNDWILEGTRLAIKTIKSYGVSFYTKKPACSTAEDCKDIPF
ncbi:hypothetical protein I8748_20105 [Nostoc sp. CENA67]|uniref:Uncharacterized protein n=1 Tax=Amazonocrinis nigriterrae CENA67 TaxID=2794033 RepID=A0A8J7HS62_9NOST|nr:hypothetical protein [Amazonocrinis nigriterrae]MBH8564457.1 hypothetical protein [Amazonocrinis nigriterrae CENA67]